MLEVRRRFAEQRMRPPNYRTVVRRIEALDLRLATAKREGGKKAQLEAMAGTTSTRSTSFKLPKIIRRTQAERDK